MKKRILLLTLMLTLTAPITALADITFDGTYGGGYLSGDINAELPEYTTPRVTAIHSANAQLAKDDSRMFYVPSLDEFPFDVDSTVLELGEFAGVYDDYFNAEVGNFDLDAKVSNSDIVRTRALEILGYDILIADEKISFNKNHEPKVSKRRELQDEDINRFDACVAIYKALGKYSYDYKFDFKPDNTLTLENSPVSQKLNLLYDRDKNLDLSKGYTNILITRSNAKFYEDTIAMDVEIKPNGNNQPITLGQFCYYVKTLMELYGEPVMTEQEERMLLQVYGKKLPIYISNSAGQKDSDDILEAIKYLVAKGILCSDEDKEYDFTGILTLNDMLDILAAVKDRDSRYTFKDIELTVDATLADMGYFETDINGYSSPIQNIAPCSAIAEDYDYLVTSNLGNVDNFYLVSKKGNKVESDSDGIFKYVGRDIGNYHHFKITSNKSALKGYLYMGDYLKIVGSNGKKMYLKFGGGTYKYKKSGDKIKRSSFTESKEELPYCFDVDTKYADQQETGIELQMAPQKATIPIKFSLPSDTWKTDIENLSFKGKDTTSSLKDLKDNTSMTIDRYTIKRNTTASNGFMFFTVEGCTDMADFQKHIIHDKSTSRYNDYQTFVQKDSTVLVNFNYLQDVGLAKSYLQLDNEVILLTTSTNNIYLCPKQKWIIVGNTVYDMPENSLMYYVKDGQLFVDYRAATGWAGDFYTFKNDSGTITLSVPSSAMKTVDTKSIITPFNKSTLKVQTTTIADRKDCILLNSTYPLANYIVYDGSEASGSYAGDTDYLFVFKLKRNVKAYKSDKVARNLLNKTLGLEAPEEWLVYCYLLYGNEKSKANPPGVKYSDKYGYYYLPVKADSNYAKRYYHSCLKKGSKKTLKNTGKEYPTESKDDIVIPIVKDNSGNIIDINFNTFSYQDKSLPYGSAPYAYLFDVIDYTGKATDKKVDRSESVYSKLVYKWKPNGKTDTDKVKYGTCTDAEMKLAPTGVVNALASITPLDYKQAVQQPVTIYAGTIATKIDKPSARGIAESKGKAMPSVKIRSTVLGYLSQDDISELNILRSTANGYVLGIPSDIVMKAVDPDRAVDAKQLGINAGLSLRGFDWEKFKFKNLIQTADDAITIATIALLNFIPRIAIFLFLSLIGLSLITDVKIWQIFCDRVFDIYKFFTIGRQDVHTINTFNLFWTSILALAVFGLFMEGTIINVIAWLARFGAAVLSK